MKIIRTFRASWAAVPAGILTLLALAGDPEAAAAGSKLSSEVQTWPRWRGASFDGTARADGTFSGSFGLKIRWRQSLGSGYSGVVVAEGSVATLFSDGGLDYLAALDIDSGAERWRFPIAPTFPGREGAKDGPVSTPAIANGVVFALGPSSDLLAVRLESGELIWRQQLAERLGVPVPHWGVGTSPLVAGQTLIVQTGGTSGRAITGFDRQSGEILWQTGDDSVNYQSPMLLDIDGSEQLIAAGDTTLFGLEPRTGKLRWRYAHEGDRFYRKIINPVSTGDGRLLLNHRREVSTLIDLGPAARPAGESTDIQEVWTTPHLKLNYATPIYHEGYFYGFSGNFLSCVDARDGKLIWKSRPPGNGWPILVDGHLVVVTKRGTLHVAEATPEGYREKATLEAFSNLVWTPPSFAAGRIYARDSFGEVVSVEIVEPHRSSDSGHSVPSLGTAPQSRFAVWIESLEQSPEPQRLVEQRLAEEETLPIIEDDRWALFVYRGEATDLALRGNMLEVREELPMHRVPGTDLFYASFEFEADARINYQFIRDLEERIPDPANPRRSDSIVYSGQVSQLLMPRAEEPSKLPETPSDARGHIESFTLESEQVLVGAKTWGGPREISVYLPVGYDSTAETRYPTIYFLYGQQMLEQGALAARLDALIGSRMRPVIGVFVSVISAYEYARSQRIVHGDMLVRQVVPAIDDRYLTLNDRAIVGVDEGAYAALETALRHRQAFGKVSAQSILPIGNGGDELLSRVAEAAVAPLEIYLDWGRYDQRDSRDGTDVAAYSRRLRAALEQHGHRALGREWNDGSDLVFWVSRLEGALETLYPPQQ